MSTLTQRAEHRPSMGDLPFMRASKSYFLLGQNAGDCGSSAKTPARRTGYSCRAKRPCDSHDWKAPTRLRHRPRERWPGVRLCGSASMTNSSWAWSDPMEAGPKVARSPTSRMRTSACLSLISSSRTISMTKALSLGLRRGGRFSPRFAQARSNRTERGRYGSLRSNSIQMCEPGDPRYDRHQGPLQAPSGGRKLADALPITKGWARLNQGDHVQQYSSSPTRRSVLTTSVAAGRRQPVAFLGRAAGRLASQPAPEAETWR